MFEIPSHTVIASEAKQSRILRTKLEIATVATLPRNDKYGKSRDSLFNPGFLVK